MWIKPICITVTLFAVLSGCVSSSHKNVMKQSEDHRALGEEYILQKDYTSALRFLLKAEQLYGDDPVLHKDLGIVYREKGRINLAIQHFDRALKLNQDYSEARNERGVTFMRDGKWDEAIVDFKAVIKDLLYKTPHYPLFNLGWAYYNKKNFEVSEKYYSEALAIRPNYILALRGLALTYMAMEKGSKAAKALEKAIAMHPKEPILHFDLAKAYTISGEQNKALEAYQKVIDITPNSQLAAEAKKAIAQLRAP